MLLASVIPRLHEHLPFVPFPLYRWRMCPFCHCCGGGGGGGGGGGFFEYLV